MTTDERRIVEDFVREMEKWQCALCDTTIDTAASDSCSACKGRGKLYRAVMGIIGEDS